MKPSALRIDPSGRSWSRTSIPLLALAAVLSLAMPLPAKPADPKRDKHDVDVMSVNLYVGGDIGRITALDPADPAYMLNLLVAVAGVFEDIVASEPAVRLQTVATAITARMPDVVAVEEASLIRMQAPGDLAVGGTTPATAVVYDYLQMLVADLAAQGAHYKVVATANEIDVELPMLVDPLTFATNDVRLSDREAILVRSDLPPGHLRVAHPQSGNFATVLEFPTIGLAIERGWCAVDVTLRGRDFRFVCAHTEEETSPDIQAAQVEELLSGPAKARQPVILVGDFNADALQRDGSYAYELIPAAGFADAWAKLHPHTLTGGLTWGHDALLADPSTAFDRRIDFVFYHGKGLRPVASEVVDLTTGLSLAPLWASDHAAVCAGFELK